MDPFASATQYEARYGTVAGSERATLGECLGDATAMMCAALDSYGVDYSNPSDDYADRLMRVCRSMAHRAMQSATGGAADVPYGVSQASQSAGGYSMSYSFSNPYGDLFITSQERRMLGIGGVHVYGIDPAINPAAGRGGR